MGTVRTLHPPQADRGRRFAIAVMAAALTLAIGAGTAEACRFWGLIGDGYADELLVAHLQDGKVANLRSLGGINRDGWAFGSFLRDGVLPGWNGPVIRRGGPPATHPTDPDYLLAARELRSLRPKASIGHVRAGTSGHWGIPNPHPFQHEGMLFAHNGGISETTLVDMLTSDDPQYLNTYPPDYVDGYIDSELYFLYLLKYMRANPNLGRVEGLRRAVREVSLRAPGSRLNFVATSGDTLFALRCSPYDDYDPVRYYPAAPAGAASPFWIVASEVLGSAPQGWGTIPARSLAVFVPGQDPRFYSIEPTGGVAEPPRLGLGTVHPNPTRGGARLAIDLPEAGVEIEMSVWDAAGRLVWTEPSVRYAGEGAILRWEGIDAQGRPAPAGIYYWRITIDGRTWSRSVSLLR